MSGKAGGGDYAVGYKRPPALHQFKKGASGNPSGRPRGKTAAPPPSRFIEIDDILLHEALRPITVRENDQTIQMPMIQAVVRSLGVSAVKGHHRSQLAISQMVKSVQAERAEAAAAMFRSVVEYKAEWEEAFKRCDAEGEPRPEPVPHPEEIVLDFDKLQVRANGPSTPDEKALWDRQTGRLKDAREAIADMNRRLKRPGKLRAIYEQEIVWEQNIVDLISPLIPDQKTRRAPGFDLQKWRLRQLGYARVSKARARRVQRDKTAGRDGDAKPSDREWPKG